MKNINHSVPLGCQVVIMAGVKPILDSSLCHELMPVVNIEGVVPPMPRAGHVDLMAMRTTFGQGFGINT